MQKKHKKYLALGSVFALLLIAAIAAVIIKYDMSNKHTEKPVVKKAKQNAVYKAPSAVKEDIKYKYNDKSIPILMYHSISYEKGNPIRLPKEKFREQMQYLKNNGYTTLSLDDVYDFIVNNKPVPEKSVAITFDDGYADNYENAYPILKEFGFKATVFVITSTVDKDPAYLTSRELIEMQQNGISIESHTVTHKDLDTMSYDTQLKELTDSKIYLENLLGNYIKYIAYPSGKYNDKTIEALKKSGYSMALTADGKWASVSDGIYKLKRVYISANYDISVFRERITNPGYPYIND